MTNNSLIPYSEVEQFGSAMVASGYFKDAQKVSQAIVKIQAGAELGLPPFASMSGIHIIQGKPVLGANVLATLIANDPRYNYRVTEMSDENVTIVFYEGSQVVGESSFSAGDAKKAGTKNMGKFPRNMLFARAMSNGAKWYTPGIFGGMPVYTPEDFDLEVNEGGDIIEGQTITPPQAIIDDVEPEEAPPLPDDEVVISETSASGFLDSVVALIDRYDNIHAAKNALKKLGYTSIPGKADERLAAYRKLKTHAAERDAETLQPEDFMVVP